MSGKKYYDLRVGVAPGGDIDDAIDAVNRNGGVIVLDWKEDVDA